MSNRIRDAFQALLATATLPDLGPQPRAGRASLSALNRQLEDFCAAHPADRDTHQCLRSLALLWHDHLDESHSISQEIHTSDGSFLHGIMHRREPDYSNAKYWFQRVGDHPVFPAIARKAADVLQAAGRDEMLAALAPGGRWDAFAFIDACEDAIDSGDVKRIEMLKQIQAIEVQALLDLFLGKIRKPSDSGE